MPHPAVLFNPQAAINLRHGFGALSRLLATTLGPTQGRVLHQTDHGPETLSDAATLARRFLGLPDRAANPGAMLARNLVWQVGQQVGDGSATAAVVAHAILSAAAPLLAAGINPAALRNGLAEASQVVCAELARQAWAVTTFDQLAALAHTMTSLPDLSRLLAELFELLGPDAAVTIEDYVAPYLEREYHAGGRWSGRLVSPYLLNDPTRQRAVSSQCAVALFAGSISEVAAVQPLLEALIQTDQRRLLLVAEAISGAALQTLVLNQQRGTLQIIAVELRRAGQQRLDDFSDLAALTGAELYQAAHGATLANLPLTALGTAQRVEASTDLVSVSAAQPAKLREHIEQLRVQLDRTPHDQTTRTELQARLGRLTGGSATLHLGASSAIERQHLRQQAERALRAMPLALKHGVVVGGGRALLNCQAALNTAPLADEAAHGRAVLHTALAAPFLQIARNAGRSDANALLAAAIRHGPTSGYDALGNQIVDLAAAGIVDPLPVVQAVIRSATSTAALLLTTEALVLKRNPATSFEP